MAMQAASVLASALLLAIAPSAWGHGYLAEPPARNVGGSPRNGHCPHCGNGGGVCGDGGQWPSTSNYVGGQNAGPQRTFTAGELVEFAVTITAHHRGHMELHVCEEHLGPLTPDPEGPSGCLSKWVLERVPPEEIHSDCVPNDPRDDCQPLDQLHPERWYLPPGTGVHKMHFRIPQGLQCTSCTLQWRWWTANSCIPAEDYGCYFSRLNALGWDAASWCGVFCGSCSSSLLESNASRTHQRSSSSRQGCGEEFRNCADITVLGSGSPSPTPTPTPTQTPSPTPMPTPSPTPAPTPAPAGTCVQNADCAANAWCSDTTYVTWCPLHNAGQCPSPQCVVATEEPNPTPVSTPMPSTSTSLASTTTAAPAPSTTAVAASTTVGNEGCQTCTGDSPCIWDGVCYPAVARDACEQSGQVWCGEASTATAAPTPSTTAEIAASTTVGHEGCQTCTGHSPCIWDGVCYPAVARDACEQSGQVWCGEAEPEPEPEPEPAAMQVASEAPQARRKGISRHNHGFLATALIQAATALGRMEPVSDASEEL